MRSDAVSLEVPVKVHGSRVTEVVREVTPHTLRHSFASAAEDLGMSIPTISALVGHSGGGNATSRYIHKLDATLVTAANRVAESIATMMDRPQDDDRIVTMPIRQVG